jgi:alpha-beta hydrolase superfamily lysophospholipase
MKATEFNLTAKDGVSILVHKWEADSGTPNAILQIAHGMGEHAARYADFAGFMAKNGFVVYANDHRGHGETARSETELGFFAADDGWNKVVEDAHELSLKIKEENPGLPLFLLGHSMGSFIARDLISKYSADYQGVVLSGTTGDPGAIAVVGTLIGKLLAALQGKTHKNKFLHDTAFGKFNAPFKPNRTEFDWLSRDEKVVDDYAADPKCGMIMSIGFILDLTGGISYINSNAAFEGTSVDLPVLLVSGEADPVSDGGKGVKEVYEKYILRGLKDLQMKLYPQCRHEILNELNKEEIYQDILNWMKERL